MDEKLKASIKEEQAIIIASSLITLELASGKNEDQILKIIQILQNVTNQLTTIANIRGINQNIPIDNDVLPEV